MYRTQSRDLRTARHQRNRGASRFWLEFANPYVQFLIGGLVVVVGPTLIRWPDRLVSLPATGWLEASLLGSAASFALGLLIVRQLARFPHAHGPLYVVPVFLVTFGILAAILLMGRLEFSRYQLMSGFALSVLWGFLYVIALNRSRMLRLALVPYGEIDRVGTAPWVRAVRLAAPDDAGAPYDAVVADLRSELPDAWERFLADCALRRVPVYHVKQISEWLTGRVHIEHLSENQFGSLLTPRGYEMLKRLADLLLTVALAPLLAAAMGAIALCIRLEQPGPVLFVHKRMGFRGRPFRMVKFRTMRDDGTGPGYTQPDDQRITGVGRVLRRYRLDELPQVLNIVKGEMSWIGPRPETLELAEWYEAEVPFYRYRHIVRPGITGWAQVNQGQTAGVHEAAEKLQYDFFYIKHFSPWLDMLVIFKTLRTLANGFGAR